MYTKYIEVAFSSWLLWLWFCYCLWAIVVYWGFCCLFVCFFSHVLQQQCIEHLPLIRLTDNNRVSPLFTNDDVDMSSQIVCKINLSVFSFRFYLARKHAEYLFQDFTDCLLKTSFFVSFPQKPLNKMKTQIIKSQILTFLVAVFPRYGISI